MPNINDQPIEYGTERMMKDVAEAVDQFLNGDLRGKDRVTGFILVVFPFNEAEAAGHFIASCEPGDTVNILRKLANRLDKSLV